MDENLCRICATNEGKYVCPRCNVLYCSVKCYQSRLHLRCSEEFYKENVMDHMRIGSQDEDDVNKIKDILLRLNVQDQTNSDEEEEEEDYDDRSDDVEEEILDSDDESDIAERLQSVKLDDAEAVWEKLSESEKLAFVDFIQNGSPESLVPLWDPWWMYRKPKQKIEVVEDSSKIPLSDYMMKCPMLKSVPSLSDITKRPPSPSVRWNIINVIASYSYVMRYFNGEPMDLISESVNLLILISGNLRTNRNYESYEGAVEEVAYEIHQCAWLNGSESAISRMREDVQKILHGPEESMESFYLLAALSDIINLMEKAKCTVKRTGDEQERRQSSFSKQFNTQNANQALCKDKVKLCIKKVEYFLSWVKSCSCSVESSSVPSSSS